MALQERKTYPKINGDQCRGPPVPKEEKNKNVEPSKYSKNFNRAISSYHVVVRDSGVEDEPAVG